MVVARNQNLFWISLDGFRGEYLNKELTPFLFKFANEGFQSHYHKPNFLTNTLPNHMSAVTGLNEQDHELINNVMYNKELGTFNMSSTDIRWWNPNGTNIPIWTLNTKLKYGTSTIFWPGSHVKFGNPGILPDYYFEHYNRSCHFDCRLEYANLILHTYNHRLIMLYIDDIDVVGHKTGPFSKEINQTLKQLDASLEKFSLSLRAQKIHKNINIMITSDHGMSKLSYDRVLVLDDILLSLKYSMIKEGAVGFVELLNTNDVDSFVKRLKNHEGVEFVGTKYSLPHNFYYTNSSRIPLVIIIMKQNWAVVQNKSGKEEIRTFFMGDHGYPIDWSSDMQALFIASGPKFRKKSSLNETKMIDLYSVACSILEISDHCKNFNNKAISMIILVDPIIDYWILGFIITFIVISIIIGVLNVCRKKRRVVNSAINLLNEQEI